VAIKRKPYKEANDHPEAVLIRSRNSKNQEEARGSGILLAPRVVLTAAHGVERYDRWEVTAPYAKNGPVQTASRTARIHPLYKVDPVANDLAVLLLDDDIDIDRTYPALHDGDLYPINTHLLVVGRVDNGALSRKQLFKTVVALVPFPGNTNLYGGHPQVVEEGDSGGPVYIAGKEQAVVALVSGNLQASRGNVPTDVYIPISRKNRGWILRQLPGSEK
jgi:secreted trypsin-like serine protease